MELEILQSDKQILKIAVSGHLDANDVGNHAWELTTLTDNTKTDVILDFSGVTYLSSLGIRMIVSIFNNLKTKEKTLVIEQISPPVKEVMEIAGLHTIMKVG